MRTLPAFFVLTKPASRTLKPACMKNTSTAAIRIQSVLSPSYCGASWTAVRNGASFSMGANEAWPMGLPSHVLGGSE